MTSPPKTPSKRKSFGINAAVRDNLTSIVDVGRNDGVASEQIPIHRVLPDPLNPRSVKLDFSDPETIGEDDPARESKLEELELVRGLARTIESIGLVNPVQVFRRGDGFQLVTGHRRLLAHIILGREYISATIHRSPKVRQAQFVENAQRRDTTLSERLLGLQQVLEEQEMQGASQVDVANSLRKLSGLKETMAFRWAALLLGPDQVREAVHAGVISNLKDAARISRLPPDEVDGAIESLVSGEQPDPDEAEEPTARPERPVRRGRPTTAVKLGKVKDPNVVRFVVEKILGEDQFPDIDWQNMEEVTHAFQVMLERVAKQINES